MKAAPILVLALIAAPRPALQAEMQATKQVMPPGLGDIVATREELGGYVLRIKAKYKPEDKESQAAEALYLKAFSQYSAWITVVKLAVMQGQQKNLPKDPEYQKLTDNAEASARAFLEHAAKVTVATRPVFLKVLFDAGVKFWDFCRKRKAEERKNLADTFAELAKWPQWHEIKAVSTPAPTPSASPAKP
jgi:hypothetical protein